MVLVSVIDNKSSGFYDMMGPIFGSRQIAKEVGNVIYADDGKRWFVILGETGGVIGCASVKGRTVSDCYVHPSSRGLGYFTQILASLISTTPGQLRAVCTASSRMAFEKAGFVAGKTTKNFTFMEMPSA